MAEPASLKRARESAKERACDTCRLRKVACDKGLPSCSSCIAFGALCLYTPATAKRGRPRVKTYIPVGSDSSGPSRPSPPDSVHLPNPISEQEARSATLTTAAQGSGFEPAAFLASLRSNPSSSSQSSTVAKEQIPLTAFPSGYKHVMPGSADPSRAPSPIPLAAGSPAGVENIVPLATVMTLVDLFFATPWTRLPILHRPSFTSRLAARLDKTDAPFYQLVTNVCAVTCVWNRNLPLLPLLQDAGYLTWEDAGRRFNTATCATGHRIHQIAKAGTTICVQNILLVAAFERCLCSGVADRLFGEAERIALASHFERTNDKLDPIQNEIRRRIYWVLYMNDKVRALINNQPMLLRSDETFTELPNILQTDANHFYSIDGIQVGLAPSLDEFSASVAFCQAVEYAILKWKKHLSGSLPAPESTIESLNDSLVKILNLSIEKKECGPGILILTHSLRIELYHRYARLQSSPSQSLWESLVRTGERLSRDLSNLGCNSLFALGPTFIALVEHSYHRLHNLAGAIKDPFSAAEAAAAAESLRALLEQVSNPVEAIVCNRNEQVHAAASDAMLNNLRGNCAQLLADQTLEWPSSTNTEGTGAQDPLAYFAEPGVGTLDFLHDLSFMTFDNLSPQFDASTNLWP